MRQTKQEQRKKHLKKARWWTTSDGKLLRGVTKSEARADYKRLFGSVPKGEVFVLSEIYTD